MFARASPLLPSLPYISASAFGAAYLTKRELRAQTSRLLSYLTRWLRAVTAAPPPTQPRAGVVSRAFRHPRLTENTQCSAEPAGGVGAGQDSWRWLVRRIAARLLTASHYPSHLTHPLSLHLAHLSSPCFTPIGTSQSLTPPPSLLNVRLVRLADHPCSSHLSPGSPCPIYSI